jgi:hypothetical protein
MRSMGRVRGLARSHAVRDAWAPPHPPRLRRVPSLSRVAGEGAGGAGMFRASLSGASGRVRNNDLFPRGVPAMLAAANPPSDPVPAPVAPPMAGPMEPLNRVGKTVARCFKRSIRPPKTPVAPAVTAPMEQLNSVGKTVARCFKRSIRPPQNPGRPGGGGANGTVEQGPENCCTVFQTFHSPAPKPRSPRQPDRRAFHDAPRLEQGPPGGGGLRTFRWEDDSLPHRSFRRAGRDPLLRGIVPGVWCGRLRIARP